MLLTLLACMPNEPRYLARKAILTDDDGDGVSEYQGDCDDADSDRFPGNPEVCDDTDNDCDGLKDEDEGTTPWYPDDDADGFGDESRANYACDMPQGYITTGGDCDDGDADLNPGATETCNGVDDDCNDEVDEDGAEGEVYWRADYDEDGHYNHEADQELACEPPASWWIEELGDNNDDCEPYDETTYPGAPDVCGDGVDNDCDYSDNTYECMWHGDLDGETSAVASLVHAYERGYLAGPLFVFDGGLHARAEEADGLAEGTGALYVWTVGEGETPSHEALRYWGEPGDYVWRVAPLGTDILVGAPGHNNFDGQLRRAPGETVGLIGQEHAWVTGTTYAVFGADPTVSGDLDGDTVDDVIVSAEFDSTFSSAGGALWLIPDNLPMGSTSADLQTAIYAEPGGAYLGFGYRRALGDVDGDGIDDILVGMTDLDRVYAFHGPLPIGYLDAADADTLLGSLEDDGIGSFVGVFPDMTSDGLNDVVVGALSADGTFNAWNACGAYSLISGLATGSRDVQSERLTWFEGVGNAQLVGSAAAAGDVNNDGNYDLVMGADYTDSATVDEVGAVYVEYGPFSAARLPLIETGGGAVFYGKTEGDDFGQEVLSGVDLTGDGIHDIAASAPSWHADGVSVGAVFVIPGLSL